MTGKHEGPMFVRVTRKEGVIDTVQIRDPAGTVMFTAAAPVSAYSEHIARKLVDSFNKRYWEMEI